MTEQYSPDPAAAALAAQVLDAGISIRAGQELARQKLAEDARIKLEREGSYEVQLASQTVLVLGRMTWLAAHPYLSRFFSRTNIGVHYNTNSRGGTSGISTDPLTDGVIARLSGEHLLFSGLVFSNNYSDGGNTLNIHQRVTDHSTGAEGSLRLYSIRSYTTEKGPRVALFSEQPEIKALDSDYRRKKLKRYLSKHAYLKELGFEEGVDCNSSYPKLPDRPRQVQDKLKNTVNGIAFSLCSNEVEGMLWPYNGFEYPDEMYLKLLTLVRQMNMLLGTKTDKR